MTNTISVPHVERSGPAIPAEPAEVECVECEGRGIVMGFEDCWCDYTGHYTVDVPCDCYECDGTGLVMELDG